MKTPCYKIIFLIFIVLAIAACSDLGLDANGKAKNNYSSIPAPEAPSSKPNVKIFSASQLALGKNFTCGVNTNSQKVECFGKNQFGEIGDGSDTKNQNLPVIPNFNFANPQSLVAGNDFACVKNNQNIFCWGDNSFAQFLSTDFTNSRSPNRLRLPTSRVAKTIAAGATQFCLIDETNVLSCMGHSPGGLLSTSNQTLPLNKLTSISSFTNVQKIFVGEKNSCVLINSNTLSCWGDNSSQQLGGVTTRVGFDEISLAGDFSCYKTIAGAVQCTGSQSQGRLGNALTSAALLPTPQTVANLTGVSVTALSSTGAKRVFHTCALLNTLQVRCWGANESGQIGNSTTTTAATATTVIDAQSNAALTNVSQVVIGSHGTGGSGNESGFSCARLQNNTVKCWGNNSFGQLGINNITAQNRATTVTSLTTNGQVLEIIAGARFACALIKEANETLVKCWGNNSNGELGDGTLISRRVPTRVLHLTGNIVKISAGHEKACALTDDNLVRCWGKNEGFALGIEDNLDQIFSTPVLVKELQSTTANHALKAGHNHICSLNASQSAMQCWGSNSNGQLGQNMTSPIFSTPVYVNGDIYADGAISQLALGKAHTCALSIGGSVSCFGSNQWGQLGRGDLNDSFVPRKIEGLVGIKHLAAGDDFTCAADDAGQVFCFGKNSSMQLGLSSETPYSPSPLATQKFAVNTILSLKAGSAHVCVHLLSGAVQCWGDNSYGQIGDNTKLSTAIPVQSPTLSTGVTLLEVGRTHNCVTKNNETFCWGSNTYGELGRGDKPNETAVGKVTGVN